MKASLDVGRRNLRTLGVLALLWIALPEAIFGLLQAFADLEERTTTIPSTILAVIFSGAVAHLVIRDLQGHAVDFKAAQAAGLQLFLPVLGISLLMMLGIGLGLLLLIVPGVILAVMWSVALPARVAEGPGVMAAFHRSRTLTRGNRWPIFLVLLISVAPMLLMAVVFGAAFLTLGEENLVIAVIITPLMSAALSIIWGVVAPTIYMQLGGWAAPNVTAAVFD